ncbi:hypothetical protein BCR35DRAFT_310638 [Leucosporidium creatinivorum]|uniref:Xylulose kinase n=1 Tax=Leucosporidium creatinivorum TaxID=106004 RepID=A0A1Y2CYZ8_9BASI|nr:hypothetical protein BCR35DRAFT_310638 [Leucosporidium creatinivorum]
MAPSEEDSLHVVDHSNPPPASSHGGSSGSSRPRVPSPVLHPSRPTLPGRQSSFYSLIGQDEREDATPPLFVGFDLSATGLKLSVLSEQLLLVKEEEVIFDQDLSQYGTRGGTVEAGEEGEKLAPVLMWIAALDELLEKLSVDDFPFERVRAISGAGQQHSPVFWAHGADDILKDLDPSFDLRSQLKSAFSSPTSPTWQDSTATPEALALEDLVGGPGKLSYLTGGRGTSRSTASQILKLRHTDPTVLPATSRISLVSSFLCSILTGKLQGIDESDAAGTRLFNVEGRKWDERLCKEAGGEDIDLRGLMGEVELDGGRSLGTVSEWFMGRYGFDRDCIVCPFTGDGAAAFLSFAMKPNDVTIQTGDSDNVLIAMDEYRSHEDVQVFAHPAQSLDEPRAYYALLSLKNGFNARAWVCKNYSSSSWSTFSEQISSFSSPFTTSTPTGFYYIQPELHPYGAVGVHRFEANEPVDDFSVGAWNARALIESQALAVKSVARTLLSPRPASPPADSPNTTPTSAPVDTSSASLPPAIRRAYIHGVEAANTSLVALLSNVLSAPVIAPPALTRRSVSQQLSLSSIDSHSASIGSAMKAYWSWKRCQGSKASFIETINRMQGSTEEVFALLLAEPKEAEVKWYEERLEGWDKLKKVVVERCKEGAAAAL